jgi:hypothetical protein
MPLGLGSRTTLWHRSPSHGVHAWARNLSPQVTLLVYCYPARIYWLEWPGIRRRERYYVDFETLADLDYWIARHADQDGRPLPPYALRYSP